MLKELFNAETGGGYTPKQVKVGDVFKVSYDLTVGASVFFYMQ
ncbi:hypothetical protein [Sporosarcina sp. NPDC096371]